MSRSLELTKAMIARPSVSPTDGGCQDMMIEALDELGFTIERMPFGNVDNFWATRSGGDGAARYCVLPGTPTWCRPVHWRNGTPIPLSQLSATATCLAEAPRT